MTTQSKKLFNIINQTDITIDEDMLLTQKNKWSLAFRNKEFQEIYDFNNEAREESLMRYAKHSILQNDSSSEVAFKDFIKNHLDWLSTGIFRRNCNDRYWYQHVRKNSEQEKIFLSQIRDIFEGRFVEMLQFVCIYKDHDIKKYLASSGLPHLILSRDISMALPPESKWDSLKNELETVIILHNHHDFTEKINVHKLDRNLFLHNISLSELTVNDTKFADEIYEKLDKKVPVIMSAVSENGLTYMYRAGTSRYGRNP